MKRVFLLILASCLLICSFVGCSKDDGGKAGTDNREDGEGTDTETDTASDADTDTDVDSDSDTDSDGDSDSDGSDAGADSDTQVVDTGEVTVKIAACVDNDSDGWCAPFECNDGDPAINPDAMDLADDGVDNDCDGETDNSDTDEVACGAETLKIQMQPVRLMILLDKSGSMKDTDVDNWTPAKDAIKAALQANDDGRIEFGFDLFPTRGLSPSQSSRDYNCVVSDQVIYDCGVLSPPELSTAIDGFPDPVGGTPLYDAIERFMDIDTVAPLFTDSSVDSYLLVVSDGADTCDEQQDHQTAEAFAQLAADLWSEKSIKSYPIGFAGVDTDAIAQLDAIATSGGTGLTGYIPAADGPALQTELDKIARDVASCTYDIPEQPGADLNNVNFYFDGAPVFHNPGCADTTIDPGWTWVDDAAKNAVTFCPTACEALKDVKKVSAAFGCPPEVP